MPADGFPPQAAASVRVAIVTLDAHVAGPAERARARLARRLPGIRLTVHAAADWQEKPETLAEARAAIASADIVIANMLFLEEHIQAIRPDLEARRPQCDAMVCTLSAGEVVKLTKLGGLDMAQPAKGVVAMLKRLRGSRKQGSSGAGQMAMLRRLPKILKLLPGKAQDLRAFFLTMQYWLGGSDDNVEAMVAFLIDRYAAGPRAGFRGALQPALPVEYPEVGLYHPDLPDRITTEAPPATGPVVGLLIMRAYVLAGDTAHYDAVIRALEARGLTVRAAFAAGLDARPAIDAHLQGIDALVSLTGFSLVGGPAYNDAGAAEAALAALDVPYVAAHALEFQKIEDWADSARGLGPVEATMLIALPEIDGATGPTVFGGRSRAGQGTRMVADHERVARLADRVAKLVALRRTPRAERKLAVVLYGFPPNAGAAGTAAHLSVFESLHATLTRLAAEGYAVDVPASPEALRQAVLTDPHFGQPAAIADRVPADRIVAEEPHLREVEAVWGPAPGRHQSDGRHVFVLGKRFGNVFVGLQPAFGHEGDPMRLLFERGFAPTHAFTTFYRWLRRDFGADAVLHFGMHGALEFMPGKQTGLSGACWPDRLIGDLPNVYLYAANNPSEATLAKRRSAATIVSHLTPPLAAAGLYKGLAELKATLDRMRTQPTEDALEVLIAQAEAVDLGDNFEAPGALDRLRLRLHELEEALIPEGLHVVGRAPSAGAVARLRDQMAEAGAPPEAVDRAAAAIEGDHELTGLVAALDGRFIRPAPGGDAIRTPDVLPTGRNIHAFDPFRMPSAIALAEGRRQADRLLDRHARESGAAPRSVALVLWGSDNIKSEGGPIAQALALMGAVPRFDSYGRLSGADLVPLEDLGRPRIDVVMTLSGIFRDLLPLQTRMLAEAAYKAATADEPDAQNAIAANARAHAAKTGCSLEEAALRVFSNADGAYGANVNMLIDSGAWAEEDELADTFEARKGFAYGRDGKPARNPALLKAVLATVDAAYQNLESVELGVTTVDHYFDTLGGIARSVRRAKGDDTAVYIGDETRGQGKVRTLSEQVALETRTRALNPKWFEPLLGHGHEGVRQIEATVTNTMGWSATTGRVEPWVYQRLTETFVLDEAMRRRLAALNPTASARMAGRLLEATERNYWQPDAATLEALRHGAEELEDRMEGV